MLSAKCLAVVRALAASALVAGAVQAISTIAAAHENHAPLPTKGVTIAGDTIMLSDKARQAIGLTTAKVHFDDIHRHVTVNAQVELPWDAQAMITSLVPGKIERVLARPGETVTPGQELARVVSAQLESLQLDLLQVRFQLDLAGKLVDQRAALDRQGIIPGKTLLVSQAQLAEASAGLQIARQKLLALGLDEAALQQVEERREPLPYVSIHSPVGGIITHADVRIGEMVSPSDHLFHVINPARVWIVGAVLESDVRLLAGGQSVKAKFAALPDKEYDGQIDHLRLTLDPRARTQDVVIAVANPGGTLRPGMFGRVEISVEVAQQAIVCPVDAVIRSRTGNYLLVERMPGKYENRPVKLGLHEDGHTVVLEGVFPGDQVVVVGNSLLAALLGNEHKARVDSNATADKTAEEPLDKHNDAPVIVAHGHIELPTDQQALATSLVEGRVRSILVHPTEQVSRGQVLAEIDSLELRSVQLELLQTLTQARLVQQSLQRLTELLDEGVVAKRRRWELQSEYETLGTKVEGLQRKLAYFGLEQEAIAQLMQADFSRVGSLAELVQTIPVRAPVAGRLAGFHVVPGQVVRPEQPLFEIHDLSTVWVKGFVYERDANRVQLSQAAQVHFTAYPELEASGKVVRISPMMHEDMRVLPVWVEVSNPDHLLKSGMLARITLMQQPSAQDDSADVARLQLISPAR